VNKFHPVGFANRNLSREYSRRRYGSTYFESRRRTKRLASFTLDSVRYNPHVGSPKNSATQGSGTITGDADARESKEVDEVPPPPAVELCVSGRRSMGLRIWTGCDASSIASRAAMLSPLTDEDAEANAGAIGFCAGADERRPSV
jgi:hypothetical protein